MGKGTISYQDCGHQDRVRGVKPGSHSENLGICPGCESLVEALKAGKIPSEIVSKLGASPSGWYPGHTYACGSRYPYPYSQGCRITVVSRQETGGEVVGTGHTGDGKWHGPFQSFPVISEKIITLVFAIRVANLSFQVTTRRNIYGSAR